jgi:hypothetical protein
MRRATVGLAERRDPRIAGYLLKHLTPECRVYELAAAEKLADTEILGTLQAIASELRDDERGGYWFNRLQAAIDACRAKREAIT